MKPKTHKAELAHAIHEAIMSKKLDLAKQGYGESVKPSYLTIWENLLKEIRKPETTGIEFIKE